MTALCQGLGPLTDRVGIEPVKLFVDSMRASSYFPLGPLQCLLIGQP
jgi:hypothetical protein